MNIVVCIKQVPDPNHFADIIVDPVSGVIKREGIPAVINPVDRNAIEAGLRLKEEFGGKVTILTMGPPQAKQALEEALAMGGDEAVLLSDRAFAGSDALATARTLAQAISSFLPFDLILCGNETVDSGTAQVGPELAELLNIPHAANARGMAFMDNTTLKIDRNFGNSFAKIIIKLPALITVSKQINEPRFASVIGILAVASKSLKTYGLSDLKLPADEAGLSGSPTRMARLSRSTWQRQCELLQGEPEQMAQEAVNRVRKAMTS